MKSEILNTEDFISWEKRQLLINKAGAVIILTNGIHSDESFSGTIVWSSTTFDLGTYSNTWAKGYFIVFTGTIKLSN